MVVPRHFVLAALLASALVPLGATATAASTPKKSTRGYVAPCLLADGLTLRYAAKPASCVVQDDTTQERSLVPVTRIRWTSWTTKRGKGTGRVAGDGYQGKVVVTATKPKRCSARRVVFTRVTVAIELDDGLGTIGWLNASCPK